MYHAVRGSTSQAYQNSDAEFKDLVRRIEDDPRLDPASKLFLIDIHRASPIYRCLWRRYADLARKFMIPLRSFERRLARLARLGYIAIEKVARHSWRKIHLLFLTRYPEAARAANDLDECASFRSSNPQTGLEQQEILSLAKQGAPADHLSLLQEQDESGNEKSLSREFVRVPANLAGGCTFPDSANPEIEATCDESYQSSLIVEHLATAIVSDVKKGRNPNASVGRFGRTLAGFLVDAGEERRLYWLGYQVARGNFAPGQIAEAFQRTVRELCGPHRDYDPVASPAPYFWTTLQAMKANVSEAAYEPCDGDIARPMALCLTVDDEPF
jgi:hypothetical protein